MGWYIMKYYFLTTGDEYGAEIPTNITDKYNSVFEEYTNIDEDDYFYIGIFEINTQTLEITELISKGYMNY
jgi:hypothetical protein